MKKFTTEEIRDLLNQVCREAISFSRMVEVLNERVSDAEKPCVEDIPSYKKGDFLVKEYKGGGHYIFILDYIDDKGLIYYHCYYGNRFNTTCVKDDFGIGSIGDAYHKCLRYATDSEKELLIAELSKVGKRWNADKKCIEDIPKRKFKKYDKVRIKEGISSKTHDKIGLSFVEEMDDLIGKKMTVDRYPDGNNYVKCEGIDYSFHEDWIEPYEELKKGDLAIFWDDSKEYSLIRIYDRPNKIGEYLQHKDDVGSHWKNAIKLESKEQYERLIRGEI